MKQSDTIFTYLKFRGDLEMKNHPFNEIDAMILSLLSYIRFENIVPNWGEDGDITIALACNKYEKSKEKSVLFYDEFEEMFEQIAKTKRFSQMRLSKYVNQIDTEKHLQFSAIHIQISPLFTFIAFRGTDKTIVGWREDCNMSYMMPVPAQQMAVNYINETANRIFHKYWIGGHSKGGNLAIYGGIFCNEKIQKKIIQISSFDGPGFNRTFVKDEAYLNIKERISSYVPVASVVGLLMEHEEDYVVVKCEESLVRQHNGLTWQVNGTQFELADSVNDFSRNTSKVLKSWLSKIDSAERQVFVNGVFDVFEQAGIVEVSELLEVNVKTAASLIKAAAKLPHEQREVVGKLVKMLIGEGFENRR